jgi:IclR family mhp operon transcriptional activator
VQWPLKLVTLLGFEMMVRDSTDSRSPFAHLRTYAGHRVPLLRSAAGLAYLANCAQDQRRLLIDTVRGSSHDPADLLATRDRTLLRKLDQIAKKGHAFLSEPRLSMVAVPIITRRGVFASIAMQFYSRAITRRAVVSRYVPLLVRAAADIASFLDRSDTDQSP